MHNDFANTGLVRELVALLSLMSDDECADVLRYLKQIDPRAMRPSLEVA